MGFKSRQGTQILAEKVNEIERLKEENKNLRGSNLQVRFFNNLAENKKLKTENARLEAQVSGLQIRLTEETHERVQLERHISKQQEKVRHEAVQHLGKTPTQP